MKIFIPFFTLALFFGCAEKGAEEKQMSVPISQKTEPTDSIPFPVYMSFEEFEPYLHRSNDTTYVINFWATWCGPCVKELPYFEKLMAEKKGEPIEVILVSMDFPKDIEKKLIPFVEKRGLANSVVALADFDYNSWIDKVSPEWDGAIPFTLVYNAKSRKVKLGEIDTYEELEKFVAEAR